MSIPITIHPYASNNNRLFAVLKQIDRGPAVNDKHQAIFEYSAIRFVPTLSVINYNASKIQNVLQNDGITY